MQVTISQAAKMAGVSRATIYNDIESGTLSIERGAKGRKMVNVSELERVYKTLKNLDDEKESKTVENSQNRQNTKKGNPPDQIAVFQERLEAQRKQTQQLEELLKKEQEERKRERETSKQFEEYFKSQIENQAENIKNFTRLLEDQRNTKPDRAGGWEKSLKTMEARIANQEKTGREYKEERQKILRQNQTLKRALEQEKSKTFWQKLFG